MSSKSVPPFRVAHWWTASVPNPATSFGRASAWAIALGWAGLLASVPPLASADDSAGSAGSARTVSAHSAAASTQRAPTSRGPARQSAADSGVAGIKTASQAAQELRSPLRARVVPPARTTASSIVPTATASASASATAAATTDQGSNYDQLHRDIVIRADIYGSAWHKPQILAANYGFEGISGIPGLFSENEINLAIDAGAGVVGQLVGLDPAAPFRNITTGNSPAGIESAGFSDTTVTHTFMDAMPIEFSYPVLPSTVLPDNFRIHLNTGEVVTPFYVAQNPNDEFNERQTIVAFGNFGNRLPTDDPGAVYPVLFEVVASSTPLQLITPRGLVDGTGLSKTSSDPYDPYSGPTLVGAKLSRLSLAGDYPPVGFGVSVANHGVEYYGTDPKLYRLRLFTGGGFSPNGVSGFEPQDFAKYFQLNAIGPWGRSVTVTQADVKYRVLGGYIEVKGIADLGTGLSADPEYAYSEDHDNQFDVVVWASSPLAARSIRDVVIPEPKTGAYSPIYNPGVREQSLYPAIATPLPHQARPCRWNMPCTTRRRSVGPRSRWRITTRPTTWPSPSD